MILTFKLVVDVPDGIVATSITELNVRANLRAKVHVFQFKDQSTLPDI